ncbi:MAG: polysaccharide deacetylase family protein [Fimbriimonadaceae bacterium]|nr:polysaccharide deacetylase family protein [Fimbriimonadaceae bacterium]
MAVPILCYHKVGSEAEEGRRLNVDPARLRAHVRYFARRGARFALARELAEPWPARAVCLTFDDAYASTVEHGLPVLLSEGARASLYAVPSLVGATSAWDGEQARPLADWDALREAQAQGFEIGNHTITHVRASAMDAPAFAQEVEQAQRRLQSEGLEPSSFCYPYGACSATTRTVLAEQGIQVALALGKRAAEPADDPLALPRIVVAFSDALPKLLYKLHIRPKLP